MARVMQTSDARRALNRLRRVGGNPRGGLEGAGLEGVSSGPDLTDDRIKTSLDAARERFREIAERTGQGRDEVSEAQKQVLEDAEDALTRLAVDGESANLSDRHMIGLEAIVVPDGTRPALFVRDDDVDPVVAEAGSWQARISTLRDQIGVVAESVGRINIPVGFPNYAGTGFVVADGLVLTNKHVLEFLTGGPDPQPDGTWRFLKPVTIDFAAEFESKRTKSFKVKGVRFASADRINNMLNPANLDVALLDVEHTNENHESLPSPLILSSRLQSVGTQAEVYVMGYPARPLDEVGEVLMRVFQDEYFVKRFAPGFVAKDPDEMDDGGHNRVFTHDSSTLGGNSGSCVIEFRIQGKAAVGLHFGGQKRLENYAHSIARIKDVLVEHGAVIQDN
jgi:V8-like Glu-specific endopeptidase